MNRDRQHLDYVDNTRQESYNIQQKPSDIEPVRPTLWRLNIFVIETEKKHNQVRFETLLETKQNSCFFNSSSRA